MRPWHEEVQSIANLFTDNWDDELLRGNFVDLVLQLTLEQPLKAPFLAAVILVANADKPEIVDILLTKLVANIESRIRDGEWRDVKLYLKLLACLQSCLEGEGLFPVLEELFSRAVDLQTASSEDVCYTSDFLLEGYFRELGADWLTQCLIDDRNGAGQDHPLDTSLCYGGCAGSMAAKGCGSYGENRGHCC